jgi:hypothetical protein
MWVQEAAERFWADAGGAPDSFPRDLRRAIALALPLAVVDLPRLHVSSVAGWLGQRGITIPRLLSESTQEQDRPVRACLLVHESAGFVFLDGADPDDERRLSLAHEVAHFLIEYALPRERALQRLGADTLPVLEGRRQPSRAERIEAILAGVELRLRLHLLERTSDGQPQATHISSAERRADTLALELLAPVEVVRSRLSPGVCLVDVCEILQSVFGLPAAIARGYARQLVPGPTPDQLLLERLGFS